MFGVTFITLITGKAAIRNGQNHFINNVLGRHCLVVRFGAQTKIDNFCYVAKIENPLTNCQKQSISKNIFKKSDTFLYPPTHVLSYNVSFNKIKIYKLVRCATFKI